MAEEQQMGNITNSQAGGVNPSGGMPKVAKWLIGLIVVGAVGWGGYYFGKIYQQVPKQQAEIPKPTAPVVTEEQSAPKTEIPKSTVTKITDPGVTWLAKPQKVDRLNLLKDEGNYIYYYKIADLQDGGELYYVAVQELGTTVYRFKKTADSKYYLLKNNSSSFPTDELNFYNPDLYKKSKIQTDYQMKYLSLLPPDIVKIDNLSLNKKGFFLSYNEFYDTPIGESKNTPSNPPSNGVVTKIGETEYGDVYKIENSQKTETENGQVKDVRYFIKLSDTSVEYYAERVPILADDGSFVGTFDQTKLNGKKYDRGLAVTGCGYRSQNQYGATITQDRVKKVGSAKEGGSVYTPTSDDDPILKIAYGSYSIGRENDANKRSYASFVEQTPVLIWKSPAGYYYLFMDKDIAPLAECGKPVVYLYPEKDTKVSIKVGAEVKVSEPNYGAGWNVLAKPSGELIWNGEKFDSLYWEGKGHGVYPEITQGRVVETKNIESELRSDLSKLGLNSKETQDFIAFWLPKISRENYTRLTWFETKQMDALAPLSISPKPDTVIRIFLDFAGQDTPETNLIPQKLSSIPRNGFTAVEWGGLLIGK